MKTIGIFGTSGFAREVADIAHELGHDVIYIARDDIERKACLFSNDVILESDIKQHEKMQYVIGIGNNAAREMVAQRFLNQLTFVNLIHPSASFGHLQRDIIKQKKGVIICAGVRFANNITIGDFTIFNLNATLGHDVIVEDFVNVAPGANISGNVRLNARCWIGTGAAINQGSMDDKLTIGSDTVIGSGSMVSKSCESNAVYFGVPVRKIK